MSDRWSEHPGTQPPTTAASGGWSPSRSVPVPIEPPTFGSGPPMPALPPPKPPSGDRTLVIVASSLGAVLLLAIGLLIFVSRQDTSVAAGPGTTTTSKAPTTTTTTSPTDPDNPTNPGGPDDPTPTTEPPLPVTPPVTRPGGVPPSAEQVEELIAEITAFVEKERGLTFEIPLEVELVSDTAFAKKLEADLDEGKDQRVKTGRILAALGLVESRLDYDATVSKLQSIGVVAFYDVSERVLVLRAVQLTPYLKASLAREIARALDDAYFNLNRPQYNEAQDEIAFGFQSVVEGDARRIEAAYIKTMSAPDQDQRKREESQFASDNPAPDIPSILFEVVGAPAELGVPFVQKLVERGGNEELSKAFTDPPKISAQVLHADRWFAHDEPVEVEKPTAEGEVFAEGLFGEQLTRLMLGNDGIKATADKAAEGWAGDWYVAWDDGRGGSCIRINFKMLTPTDLTELEDALADWVEARGGKAQLDPNEEREMLQLTSCSTTSGGGTSPA